MPDTGLDARRVEQGCVFSADPAAGSSRRLRVGGGPDCWRRGALTAGGPEEETRKTTEAGAGLPGLRVQTHSQAPEAGRPRPAGVPPWSFTCSFTGSFTGGRSGPGTGREICTNPPGRLCSGAPGRVCPGTQPCLLTARPKLVGAGPALLKLPPRNEDMETMSRAPGRSNSRGAPGLSPTAGPPGAPRTPAEAPLLALPQPLRSPYREEVPWAVGGRGQQVSNSPLHLML